MDSRFVITIEPCGHIISVNNPQANPLDRSLEPGVQLSEIIDFFTGMFPMSDKYIIFENVDIDGFKGAVFLVNHYEKIEVTFIPANEDIEEIRKMVQLGNQKKLRSLLEEKNTPDNCTEITGLLEFMVFEKTSNGYKIQGKIPDWFAELFPHYNYSSSIFDLEGIFPFLEVFLPHAEKLYKTKKKNKIVSGLWTNYSPDNKEYILQAVALAAERCFLIIKSIKDVFPESQLNLQRSREAQLKHHQLIKTENTLRKVIRQKEQFISFFSHDIKSPMTGIYSLADYLLNDEELANMLTDQYREIFISISNSIKDLYNYSVKLYNWAKVDYSVTPDALEEILVENIFEDFPLLYKNELTNKDLRMEILIENGLKIFGDEVLLRNVYRNLISNAIKFSNQNGVIKIIGYHAQNQIIITVSDQGVGIDEKTQRALLEGSQTVTSIGTMGEHGTGLGIRMVRKILQAHDAKFDIKSSPGKGTKVYTIFKAN